jgi:peptidoglycan lytic transglycosylase
MPARIAKAAVRYVWAAVPAQWGAATSMAAALALLVACAPLPTEPIQDAASPPPQAAIAPEPSLPLAGADGKAPPAVLPEGPPLAAAVPRPPEPDARAAVQPPLRAESILQRGGASWYGTGFHNRRTASGERFDMAAMTAAHRTLPFGTLVCVHSVVNEREVLVRINDRGPHAAGRVIDLSRGAAEVLGIVGQGVRQVALSLPERNGRPCGQRDAPDAVATAGSAARLETESRVPVRAQ